MRIQLLTELTKELDVTNEKQLKCLYSNESSLGNKLEKLELLGRTQNRILRRGTW